MEPKIGFSGLSESADDVSLEIAHLHAVAAQPPPAPRKPPKPDRIVDDGSRDLMITVIVVVVLGSFITAAFLSSRLSHDRPADAPADAGAAAADASAVAVPAATDVVVETPPAAGDGSHFGVSQIAYCLAETIRIEAARRVSGASDASVSAFNAFVIDYNNRCSRFSYQAPDMARAEGYISAQRASLVLAGEQRMAGYAPPPPTVSPSMDTQPQPSPVVDEPPAVSATATDGVAPPPNAQPDVTVPQ